MRSVFGRLGLVRLASSPASKLGDRKKGSRKDVRLRSLRRRSKQWAHASPGTVSVLGILVTVLGVFFVIILGSLSRAGTATQAADPKAVAFTFAGKSVTAGQLGQAELGQAKSLFSSGQYAQVQRHSFERGLFDILDQIEVDKLIQLQLVTNRKMTQQQALDKLMAEVAPLQIVSEGDARAFYRAHPSVFARSGPRLHVREIVVRDESLAEQLRSHVVSGASFAQVAQQYSIDPPQYRDQGGDLGWVTEKQMSPDWSQQVFALSKGEISQPFQSGGVFYIVQNIEGPQYDVIPYGDVSPSVPIVAAQYHQREQFTSWLTAQILQEPLNIQDQRYVIPINNALADLRANPSQTF